MTDQCPYALFDGCDCAPDECRSTPVYDLTRPPLFTIRFRDYLAVVTFGFCMSVIVFGSLHLHNQFAKQDRKMQEVSAKWTK